MLESWQTVYHAAGITREDRVLFAFSFGPFIGFWMAYEAATQMGCLCFPAAASTAPRVCAFFGKMRSPFCAARPHTRCDWPRWLLRET